MNSLCSIKMTQSTESYVTKRAASFVCGYIVRKSTKVDSNALS